MTIKSSALSEAVRYGLAAGAVGLLGLAPAPVFAQADEATTLDRIQVTGSRIRRVDIETASPVFVIEREDIARSGAVTVGDFLQETPAIAGAATNPQVNNGGGAGTSTVSLRGLGPDRTLLLVNGRRMVTQDVNAIPVNMIERVEVLKDGASAIYGSDAIGGVVNFILRSDLDGAEAALQYGISDRDDAETVHANAAWGATGERSNVQFGFTYDKNKPVLASDRPFSAAQAYYYYGEVFFLGSSRAPGGRWVIPRDVATSLGIALDANCGSGGSVALTRIAGRSGVAPTDYRCFNGAATNDFSSDIYNFQPLNFNLTPVERIGMFATGNHAVSDSADLYVEAYYHNTVGNFQIAEEPFDGRPGVGADVPISGDNVYNPFGVDIIDGRLRLAAVGPRTEEFETDRLQINFGLRGTLGTNWGYDLGASYGKLQQTSEAHGELNTLLLRNALGPSFLDANGVPVCGTPDAPIAGCSPVNFFGPPPAPGTDEFAALQALAPFMHDRTNQELRQLTANIDGELFELPAGPLALAVGVEYREESYDYVPDVLRALNPLTGNCGTSGNCSSATKGEYDVSELYAELLIPVLADMPFAQSVNISLGSRYSDYSTFGDTTNSKIGLEWRPIESLLIRGTFAEVFRAPTLTDLFTPETDSADTFLDPCNGTTTNPNGACNNVPLDGSFQQTDSQTNANVGGNASLQPEEGWVRTIGVVWDPQWVNGLSLNADIWHIKLEDAIGQIGTSNILSLCYNQGLFCDRFSRNAAGEIIAVDNRLGNVGRFDTKGVDFGVKYNIGETDWGNFRVSLDTTYINKFDKLALADEPSTFEDFAGEFAESSAGGEGHFGRWRALGNVAWSWGDFEASWSTRYIHHVDELELYSGGLICGPSGFCPDGPTELRIGSQAIHDIQAGWNFPMWGEASGKVSVGVDNVNDKLAPLIYGGFNGSTDMRTYDAIGRFFWARLEAKF